MSLRTIKEEWSTSKILITQNFNLNYVLFLLGQYNIYVHKIMSIVTDPKKPESEYPHILEVKTPDADNVQDFILSESSFKAYKIFKHGNDMKDLGDSVGLAANTMKNLLNLFIAPKVFCISCKDPELKKQFYDLGIKVNKEDNLGHLFDYEVYDYKVIIKKYTNHQIGKSAIVVILTGPDMPNAWNV